MKPTVQRKGNIVHAPKVKKVTNKQNGPAQKASGTKKEVDPLTKIKLQLFPVDENTRLGLEKDGLNPFLELTLSAKKKISSVINHIHTKWGGSSITQNGEPIVLPYGAHPAMPMTRIWTSNDTVITAGDVYAAVQNPAIFRLSYGWFSLHELQRVSAATDLRNCIKSETIDKPTDTTEERKCLDATAEASTVPKDSELKISQSNGQSISPLDDDLTNLTMGGLLSDASGIRKISNNEFVLSGRNTDPWDDSLTTLSIGGLLSEASLQAKINNSNNNKSDTKANETFISDSFDAIIFSQAAKPSSIDSRSSILDAEETCHAFAFRKFSSSTKNVRVSARATQDSSSNSFRFPHFLEANKQAMHSDDKLCSEPKTELFPRSQQFDEDSKSLGLRGLTWNESLGPFDLGNSMSWKVSGGGNV